MPNHTIATQKTKKQIEYVNLPRKILDYYEHPHLIDCILYELIDVTITRISLTAYNPDFYLCKGIAGVCLLECNDINSCPWESPNKINELPFNQYVKKISFQAAKEESIDETLKNLQSTYLSNYTTEQHTFKLKNNNIGILNYTINEQDPNINEKKEYLSNAASILGLCLF